jgi:hypothetical protein
VQSAYKRLLVDKLKEKDDRLRFMQIKKDKIKHYQEKNGFNVGDFVQMSV